VEVHKTYKSIGMKTATYTHQRCAQVFKHFQYI